MMLTGNIGKHGAGVFTWAGNYKGALFQASPWSGPGVGELYARGPLQSNVGRDTRITHDHLRHCSDGEDPSYWACGERTLTVDLPKGGRRTFTGQTHTPHANQSHLVQQRQFSQSVQVDLQPDRPRAAEGRHDHRPANRMDRLGRVFRRRVAGEFVGRI